MTHEKNLSSFLFFRCHAKIFRHKNAFFKERLLLTKLKTTLPTEKRRKEKRFIEAAAVLRRRLLVASIRRTTYVNRGSLLKLRTPRRSLFHRIQSNVMSRRFMTTSPMRNCVVNDTFLRKTQIEVLLKKAQEVS